MADPKMKSLGDRFDRFVEQQLDSGAYRSPDDVLRAGLDLLERREHKKAALHSALLDGERSADFQEVDWDQFLSGDDPLRRAVP